MTSSHESANIITGLSKLAHPANVHAIDAFQVPKSMVDHDIQSTLKLAEASLKDFNESDGSVSETSTDCDFDHPSPNSSHTTNSSANGTGAQHISPPLALRQKRSYSFLGLGGSPEKRARFSDTSLVKEISLQIAKRGLFRAPGSAAITRQIPEEEFFRISFLKKTQPLNKVAGYSPITGKMRLSSLSSSVNSRRLSTIKDRALQFNPQAQSTPSSTSKFPKNKSFGVSIRKCSRCDLIVDDKDGSDRDGESSVVTHPHCDYVNKIELTRLAKGVNHERIKALSAVIDTREKSESFVVAMTPEEIGVWSTELKSIVDLTKFQTVSETAVDDRPIVIRKGLEKITWMGEDSQLRKFQLVLSWILSNWYVETNGSISIAILDDENVDIGSYSTQSEYYHNGTKATSSEFKFILKKNCSLLYVIDQAWAFSNEEFMKEPLRTNVMVFDLANNLPQVKDITSYILHDVTATFDLGHSPVKGALSPPFSLADITVTHFTTTNSFKHCLQNNLGNDSTPGFLEGTSSDSGSSYIYYGYREASLEILNLVKTFLYFGNKFTAALVNTQSLALSRSQNSSPLLLAGERSHLFTHKYVDYDTVYDIVTRCKTAAS
ncbi:hypothetical protein BABINDRAFT_162911 [Babjeviella inositovora NRRL Y-12698]|uniref:Uncharacterized protein n=1 Tax=Babjeviella inositovora NRRL Y-12698 TaxID=984486 RepID=A0A1E3QKN1_9ASCO|nr:uncharacterized protein BABINDRAFT_162911 [Babjeviella inositovora NRRL Y-12698]ODQ78256.1 hypothetical protein BABINDRAFT_162911 [Babjeviella inositovora NRRL Y-12698]